jgi:hypothetical protein
VHPHQDIPDITRTTVCLVRGSNSTAICEYGYEAEEEGEGRDAEEQECGPENGRGCPGMERACDYVVLGEIVLC